MLTNTRYTKTEYVKRFGLVIALVGIAVIIGYCLIMLIQHKAETPLATLEMPEPPATWIWGSYPDQACNAFADQNLFTSPYTPIKGKAGRYNCVSAELVIPDSDGKKTLIYEAEGVAQKVTDYTMTLKMKQGDNSKEAIASKKVWTIYVAVLVNKLFEIQLGETDLQSLANLKEGKSFTAIYDEKLKMVASATPKDGNIYYKFKAVGLPMTK